MWGGCSTDASSGPSSFHIFGLSPITNEGFPLLNPFLYWFVICCSLRLSLVQFWQRVGLKIPSQHDRSKWSQTTDRRWEIIYDSFSDVGESRVWFPSKNLTPCRLHSNAFLIAQIIGKCHSFPNMYDMLWAKVDRLAGKAYFVQKNT